MKSIVLQVSGMSCAHCEARVMKSLKKNHGVLSVVASAKNNQVEVVFDDNLITISTIKTMIEDAGYHVEA